MYNTIQIQNPIYSGILNIFGPISLQLGLNGDLRLPNTIALKQKKKFANISAGWWLLWSNLHCIELSSILLCFQTFLSVKVNVTWVNVVSFIHLSNDVVLSILRHLQDLDKPNRLNS